MKLLGASGIDRVVYDFGRSDDDPEKTADWEVGLNTYVKTIQEIITKYSVDPKMIDLSLLSHRQIEFLLGLPAEGVQIEKILRINIADEYVRGERTLLHLRDPNAPHLTARVQMYCAHLQDASYDVGANPNKNANHRQQPTQINFDLKEDGMIFVTLETLMDKALR